MAAGSGNVAIPAAASGREVTATDLTPELLDKGRADAEAEGLDIKWRVADAEALPCDDGEYDAALSCVGIMFAPHHQAGGRRARAVRPPGRHDRAAQLDAGGVHRPDVRDDEALRPGRRRPAPSRRRCGATSTTCASCSATGSRTSRRGSRTSWWTQFATPEEFREFFKTNYGPTIAVYKAIADDPEKVAALDRDLVALAERFDRGDGHTVLDWEYLLVTARRV